MTVDWTDEQRAILRHTGGHARIQAGPGTGKSTTVIALAGLLSEGRSDKAIRLATFSRAATAELASMAVARDVPVQVNTVHSFALTILVRNREWGRLPSPIRIPDEWEAHDLLHDDLRLRLAPHHPGIRRATVERLEREMAAQWEAMDDTHLRAGIAPDLRAAYLAAWQRQRRVFGYSLFAEMPWYALDLIDDHPDADLDGLECLVVDEYQDLNRCETRLLAALAGRGIAVLGVGDPDQSIYSWRMAAPEGIRRFLGDFAPAQDYSLSVSQRCGRRILESAQRLIASGPGRDMARPAVRPASENPDGAFAYLRFRSAQAERRAAVRLLKHHHETEGIGLDRMAILLRSDHQHRWSTPLRSDLERAGVLFTDVEAASEPLHTEHARELLAVAKLALNRQDDLAWWTILKVCRGVADSFIRQVADVAWAHSRRFADQLLRLPDDQIPEVSATSTQRAVGRVRAVTRILDRLEGNPLAETARWIEWLREVASLLAIPIAEDLERLLITAGGNVHASEGIRTVLAQLEPVARDIAMASGGVRVMTIARSKGLTFDVVAVLGVEQELYPSPLSEDPEEDRRLLYVAITRARLACYLTMARIRHDATAFSGRGDSIRSRSRCEFLSIAGIRPDDGDQFLRDRGVG